MEASAQALALRPRSATEVIDLAARLYRRNVLVLWRIAIPFAVLAQAIFVLLVVSAIPTGSVVRHNTLYVPTTHGSYDTAVLLGTLVQYLLIDLLVQAAMFRVFSETIVGHRPKAGPALRMAFGRFFAVLVLSIMRALIIGIGFVLVIIPGIYLLVGTSVVLPVLLFERVGPLKAIGRSRDLVTGRWWATFGTILLWVVLYAIFEIVFAIIISALFKSSINSVAAFVLVGSLARIVPEILFAPFGAAVFSSIYFDLKVRKEAFDLEVIAAHLAEHDGRQAISAGPGGPFAAG